MLATILKKFDKNKKKLDDISDDVESKKALAEDELTKGGIINTGEAEGVQFGVIGKNYAIRKYVQFSQDTSCCKERLVVIVRLGDFSLIRVFPDLKKFGTKKIVISAFFTIFLSFESCHIW